MLVGEWQGAGVHGVRSALCKKEERGKEEKGERKRAWLVKIVGLG